VAEIRPQVNGLIQKRLFTEGAMVAGGEPLYEIDAAPYQAAYDLAKANLTSALEAVVKAERTLDSSNAALERYEALLELAKVNYRRCKELLAKNAVAGTDHDQAKADLSSANANLRVAKTQVESDRQSVEMAKAAVKQAEASLESANINLKYTKIQSPISGRIGRSNVTDGAIATAYQTTALATVQQLDPIYVDVPQSTVELLRLKRNLEKGRLQAKGSDKVKIILEEGTEYPQLGSFQFCDVTVDQTTGSVVLRILVRNPDHTLLPGMYVRAVIEEGMRDGAILVPQQAVSRDPKGNPLAMVVDGAGTVQQRPLTTDRAIGSRWLVSSGLGKGDRVVVEGMQKVRPGMPVKAVHARSGDGLAASAQDRSQARIP